MSMPTRFEDWPARLDDAIAALGGRMLRAHVARDVASTQDEARRLGLRPGEAMVAWRQTAGRGRWGRRWADTAEEGVALTIAMAAGRAERLALLGAVAAATAIERVLRRAIVGRLARSEPVVADAPIVGIKWPNDIMFDGRKLAGILVEQADGVALMGVGVNVGQRCWPDELAATATSMVQVAGSMTTAGPIHHAATTSQPPDGADVAIDRLDVTIAVLEALVESITADDAALVDRFRARDALTGADRTIRCGDETIVGTIVEIDPLRSLRVRRPDGVVVSVPAALARLDGAR